MKKVLLLTCFFIIVVCFNSSTIAQSKEQYRHIVFMQGNYLRNLGTFGQVWSQAAGGYLGYGIYFPEHNVLMFRTGFMSHSLRSKEQFDGSLNVIPLQIGGRYNFTNAAFIPYFQFMNGFNLIFEDVNLNGEKKNRTLLRYFWQVGAGGTLRLSENLILDLGLNYNSAFYDNNKELYHEAGAMMNGFEYSLGIGWLLE
jgi:hypothetical protein